MRVGVQVLSFMLFVLVSCQAETAQYKSNLNRDIYELGAEDSDLEKSSLGPIDTLVSKMLFPGRDIEQDFYRCENQITYKYDIIETIYNNNRIRYYERNSTSDEAILFLHGNGSTACDSIDLANYLTGVFDKSIIIAEYPGYSNDDQISSESSLTQSSLAIYQELSERYNKVDIFAHSLGTGVASFIASQEKVENIVLYAPFNNILSVAKSKFPRIFHPIISSALKDNMFSSDEWLRKAKGKILIGHGVKDEVIPIDFAKILFNKIDTKNKLFLKIDDADHNSIVFNTSLNQQIKKNLEL